MNKLFPLLALFLCHCSVKNPIAELPTELPLAVSNNATAYLNLDGQHQFYSFNGLKAGKTYQDITNEAYVWQAGQWHELKVPDVQLPVLASVAVSVNGAVYLFGGYTVAEDHSEKSIPHVWRIDGQNHQWTAMPPMPTPVDDTVALVYKNRYIYLVSGWHDVDNVDLVQVFDTETQTWQQASPYPLPPVFGHAGGIIGSRMLICDGVKVTWQAEKKQFLPSPECAIGSINADDVTKISWSKVLHHSGIAYYRMAAGADDRSKIYFVGGSDNPYNYDGIGYNGMPSKPSSDIRVFDTVTGKWQKIDSLIPETMDHRALLNTTKGFYILGGMSNSQKINNNIIKIKER